MKRTFGPGSKEWCEGFLAGYQEADPGENVGENGKVEPDPDNAGQFVVVIETEEDEG